MSLISKQQISQAIRAGDLVKTKEIIKAFVKDKTFEEIVLAEYPSTEDVPPLLIAASCGNIEIFEYILSLGVSIDQANVPGHTSLYMAFWYRQFEMVQYLIDHGALIDKVSADGTRIMDMALRSGSMKWVQWFLKKGFPLEYSNNIQRDSLYYAVESSNLELIRFVEKNTSFTYHDQDAQGIRPVDVCDDEKTFFFIRKKNPELLLNKIFQNGDCSLHRFAQYGQKEIVEFFLQQDIDPNIRGNHNNTLMHYAVNSGNKELVRFLLQKNISVEGRNKSNLRPLHWAAELGDLNMVKILVEDGKAKVNIKTNHVFIIRETHTPLFIAISKGFFAMAKYLIEKGADVNALNDTSNSTALTEACRMDNIDMIQFLLEHGASPNGVNADKESKKPDYYYFPLAQARSAEAVNILIQHGADVNATHSNVLSSTSALRETVSRITKENVATKEGQQLLAALKALLEHGAYLTDHGSGTIESSAKCKEVDKILSQYKKNLPLARKPNIKFSESAFFKKKPKSFWDFIGRSLLRFYFRNIEHEKETGEKTLFMKIFDRKKY